jgi:mercuric ion binding protein
MTKLVLLVVVFAVTGISAADKSVSTATFEVEKMTCATCPITVRKAMQRVEGVSEVQVDFESKSATVTYDSSTTTAQDIADASSNVGFPARIKERSTE